MKNEIKIILEEHSSNKSKGNCFEDLIRNLLTIHHYKVKGNINFSGMEIDLIAEHKHKSEMLYVECKAKEKVSSDELTKFCFNTSHKRADAGYFFRTNELEFQAGALLSELRSDVRYKSLSFFEPSDIINMLADAKMIFEPTSELIDYTISKKILSITFVGDFFIYLVNESNAFPTKFIIINAKNNEKVISQEIIELLKLRVDEIKNLEYIVNYNSYLKKKPIQVERTIETISEVQESENWFDYLPASSEKNHFIGRDVIRTQILSFFKSVQDNTTKKRIFYLNGKSGWGKSSLVLEIKGRCRNKHYKNKFYALAIDTRSAISDNFVALALKKLINKAYEDNFLSKDIFYSDVQFTSNVDLLSSESINQVLNMLKAEDKYLVLIFDQFEDVFRKGNFFKSFYKFLTDVTDLKPHIIVGFSWKSDFSIQSDDSSYHIWQQAKEQAREFSINEFGEKEIDGVIKQLEDSVGLLDDRIKSRIKESSQGLPWLTKKLCIHIYDQIQLGLIKDELIESNLNIADLFKKDEERIESNELKALKIIAKRAYDGTFFDETDVGDIVESHTITSLQHKRLIIRSGANYNIYWDIFRDYLVTGVIPPIGESYILRQSINSCIEVFLLFRGDNPRETLSSLLAKHAKSIGDDALYNILIELRNVGLVQKDGDGFLISQDVEISRDGFINYMKNKFSNYTPYLALKKISSTRITRDIVIQTLKNTFKQDFLDSTWDAYAKNLIGWFSASGMDTTLKISKELDGLRRKGKPRTRSIKRMDGLLYSSFKELVTAISALRVNLDMGHSRFYKDLFLLDVLDVTGELTEFGSDLIKGNDFERETKIKAKVNFLPKMQTINDTFLNNKKVSARELVESFPDNFFMGNKNSSKLIYAYKALSWLK